MLMQFIVKDGSMGLKKDQVYQTKVMTRNGHIVVSWIVLWSRGNKGLSARLSSGSGQELGRGEKVMPEGGYGFVPRYFFSGGGIEQKIRCRSTQRKHRLRQKRVGFGRKKR